MVKRRRFKDGVLEDNPSDETNIHRDQRSHAPGTNKRACAFLIDTLAGLVIGLFVEFSGYPYVWPILFAYWLLRDCTKGVSLGKFCLNMRVVDETGAVPSLWQLFFRNLILLIPLSQIVEYFVLRNDGAGRRMGDQFAETRVVDLDAADHEVRYFIISIVMAVIVAGVCIGFDLFGPITDWIRNHIIWH